MEARREGFGSRTAVILAMAGSAIGLGNIWRFPYVAGEHGGAVFVLAYVLATVLVSLPVFVAEVIVGRRSRTNAKDSFSVLTGGKPFWKAVGFLPVFIPLLIASYYSVIGGWSIEFLIQALKLAFINTTPEASTEIFTSFIARPWLPVVLHLLFFLLCAFIVSKGVKNGIERFSKITLPVLFVLIVLISVYSLTLPGSKEGVAYLFKPDFSKLSPKTFAYALGQSFYSLSLGMGAIITYGSYIRREENIMISSAGTAVSDLLFAMLAGLAIMPAVFAADIEPGAGPGLIFQSLPYIFSKMGIQAPVLSAVAAILFFFTIIIAAMTSLISLIEVGTACFVEKFGLSRPAAVSIITLLCGSAGVLCSLSFGPLSGITVADKNIFDIFDWSASNVLLLLMSLLVVIFVGFVMKKRDVCDEFTNGGAFGGNVRMFDLFYFLIKWVAPVAVLLIFISNFII